MQYFKKMVEINSKHLSDVKKLINELSDVLESVIQVVEKYIQVLQSTLVSTEFISIQFDWNKWNKFIDTCSREKFTFVRSYSDLFSTATNYSLPFGFVYFVLNSKYHNKNRNAFECYTGAI